MDSLVIKNNMRGAIFSRETMTSFFEKFLETGFFSVMINLSAYAEDHKLSPWMNV
jgi:hypothetical protein